MKKSVYHLFSAALLIVAVASCSKQNASPKDAAPTEGTPAGGPVVTARGDAAAIQASFSVEAVDQEKRLITLKGPQGNTGEFQVGEQVKRLSEIHAGDKIHAEYTVAAVAELREPTEEEKSAPLVAVSSGERGSAEEPPAAGIGRAVRAVTTIDAVDASAQNITVKGPMDGTVSVHVDDPTAFSHLQVGQTIVVTFAEKLVLSVEPRAEKQ
jgi:hypothetical protein